MKQEEKGKAGGPQPGGLAGWLLGRLRGSRRPAPRLAVLERVTLGPRQTLALGEAEGRRFLVATSAEGAAAIYALDTPARQAEAGKHSAPSHKFAGNGLRPAKRSGADRDLRVSW
jgi:flagellar biogenesis protein FliO